LFLHDARKCQREEQEQQQACAHHAPLCSASPALQQALSDAQRQLPLSEEPAMAAAAAAAAMTDEPPAAAAAAVAQAQPEAQADAPETKEGGPPQQHDEGEDDDDEDESMDAPPPPQQPSLRDRSARHKKVAPPMMGDYVLELARPAAVASLSQSSALAQQPRVRCTCSCAFCAPPPLTTATGLPDVPVGTKLFCARLSRAVPWPWDGATMGQWLASLHSDAFLPLQCLLADRPRCAVSGQPEGILQLLHAPPLKLLKLLRQARHQFGGEPRALELLAWSLYDHLQKLVGEMRAQAAARLRAR